MLAPTRAPACAGSASRRRPASAMRWPTIGPRAPASACSTNHGSVSASPFSVAASAGSPSTATNSSQRPVRPAATARQRRNGQREVRRAIPVRCGVIAPASSMRIDVTGARPRRQRRVRRARRGRSAPTPRAPRTRLASAAGRAAGSKRNGSSQRPPGRPKGAVRPRGQRSRPGRRPPAARRGWLPQAGGGEASQ